MNIKDSLHPKKMLELFDENPEKFYDNGLFPFYIEKKREKVKKSSKHRIP